MTTKPINPTDLTVDALPVITNSYLDRLGILTQDVTPEFMTSIIRGAEGGMLGYLYELYLKLEKKDSRFGGVIGKRRAAVARQSWIIDANKKSAASIAAKIEIERMLQAFKFSSFLRKAFNGRLYGAQAFELRWFQNGKYANFGQPIPIQGARLQMDMTTTVNEYGQSTYGQLYIRRELTNTDRIYVKDEKYAKRLIVAEADGEPGFYDIAGLAHPLLALYILKVNTLRFWAMYIETYGWPVATAAFDNDSTYSKFKTEVFEMLNNFGRRKKAVIPPGVTMQILQAAQSGTVEGFRELIRLCDTESAIMILGQNLTTEVQGGSFAAGKMHAVVQDELTQEDCEWVTEFVNDNLIAPWIDLNFPGMPEQDRPKFRLFMPEKVDVEKAARAVNEALKVVSLKKSDIYRRLGFDEPEAGDQIVEARSNVLGI